MRITERYESCLLIWPATLTGCSSRSRQEQSLVRWAIPQLHDIDALSRMVDPALKGIYPAKSLSRFADIVALCVQVSILNFLIFRDENRADHTASIVNQTGTRVVFRFIFN